jgi:4-hydroxyphenylpyruvate dioxygenase
MSANDDFLKIRSVDHVEFWVGTRQASFYYVNAFGFTVRGTPVSKPGPRPRVLPPPAGQDPVRLHGAARPEGPIAEHVHRHGDGVKDIALEVEDVDRARRPRSAARGAFRSPRRSRTSTARSGARHRHLWRYDPLFIDRTNYKGPSCRATARRHPARGRTAPLRGPHGRKRGARRHEQVWPTIAT